MPPSEVHLIGEHHFDLEAVPRYQNAFSKLKPDVVTVESDEERLELGQRTLREFLTAQYGSFDKGITQFPNHNLNASIALRGYASVIAARTYQKSRDSKIALIDKLTPQTKELLGLGSTEAKENDKGEKDNGWAGLLKTPDPCEIALLKTLGRERIRTAQLRGYTIPETYFSGLDEIAVVATEEEMSQKNATLDTYYYLLEREEINETTDLETRDDCMLERILQQDGKIVHAGGLLHFFGDYHNLYEKLKERKVNVKRHKLIDYAYPGMIGSLLYRGVVRLEARSFRKMSQQIKREAKP